jgi:hypothetical protein
VPGARAGHRVRDLVQQDLVDLVVVVPRSQVPGDGDAPVGVVAQARALLGVVELERPRGRVEVQSDERLRPDPNAREIRHGPTKAPPRPLAGSKTSHVP